MSENMSEKDIAQRYVDQLAIVLQILDQASEQQLYVLRACSEHDTIFQEVQQVFERAKKIGPAELLDTLERMVQEVSEKIDAIRFSYAMALCEVMDGSISFASLDDAGCNGKISLHSLIPIWTNLVPQFITALNSNKDMTRICIMPKLCANSVVNADFEDKAEALVSEKDKTRMLNSRDAMYGHNGRLSNVCYYPWDAETPNVKHIILANRCFSSEEGSVLPETTRIIFSPMSDRSDLLELSNPIERVIYGAPCNTVGLSKITDPKYVEKRFTDAWLAACEYNADIFFGPEMLATENMVSVENQGSLFLKPLLRMATENGLQPPRLTIMPTFWKDGKNTAYVFDAMGGLCGTQEKRTPLVNVKDGWVEAIDLESKPDVLLIHLHNRHRIAIVICAEFLANAKYVGDFLCRKLAATLILVPAYSIGEQDFMNGLSVLKPYGTSVVWGNCCGAAYVTEENIKRIVGGSSFAGIDSIYRMGSMCKCGFKCDDGKSCLFQIDIPGKIVRSKPDSPQAMDFIHHYK